MHAETQADLQMVFGRAMHDKLDFAAILQGGGKNLRFELRIAVAVLESRVDFAFEPAGFHHVENRRGEPPRSALLRVFDVKLAEAVVEVLQQL